MIGPDAFTFRALWRCYRNCRRNKRNTVNALAFEVDAEARLLDLRQALCSRSYRPGRSICFITSGVKPREVFAADFRDRVVHHLLVSYQERLFEPIFIHDSYACRRGKGTLAASDRLMTMLRRISANGRRPAWALKLDVASFFPSIHKATLYDILARRIHHPDWLWLTRTLLFHDPTENYRFRSRRGTPGLGHPDYPVAPHKSLFGKGNRRGLPIGNLTSQFWGNVYLNELDQFVKRTLRCRYYLRYVDDMILLAQEQETLLAWCAATEEFLRLRLQLALRPETTRPIQVRKGVEFVGWKTWWNRRLPRPRTFGQVRKRLDDFERAALRPAAAGRAVRIDLRRQDRCAGVERLQCTLASYSGHLRHGSAWREWASLWEQYSWLEVLFIRRGWIPAERWPRRHVVWTRDYRAQYARMARHTASDCLLFCQVGKFVEFYGPQRLLAQSVLGLRPAMLPRAGYGLSAGFPTHLSTRYVSRAIAQGLSVVEARQEGPPSTSGCAPRAPCTVFVSVPRVALMRQTLFKPQLVIPENT